MMEGCEGQRKRSEQPRSCSWGLEGITKKKKRERFGGVCGEVRKHRIE